MTGALSPLTASGRLACKVLADRLIEAAGGPEKAQHVTRVARPALSKYRDAANPDFADHFMPLDVASELTLDTAARIGPAVARHFAALTGHAVVALPLARRTDKGATREAHLAFATVARETGEVLSGFAAALADGRFDGLEARDLSVEIDEAVEALLALKAVSEAAVGE